MMADKPIIESLLDIDFYKLSMGQMIFHRHPTVPVTLGFINRTKSVSLAQAISLSQLREELEECRRLRFYPGDLHYIMGTYEYEQPMFKLDYIQFLQRLRLPEFRLEEKDGQFALEFFGDWASVTYWETLALSIVNELYYRALMKECSRFECGLIEADGRIALGRKIRELRKNPDITFSDFGTRRRFSREWQNYVVRVLTEECGNQFRGTSNVYLAKKYSEITKREIVPTGTNAHELPMVYSGIYFDQDENNPAFSQHEVLLDWESEYDLGLSIFLPDTFGSDWFFKNVTSPKQLRRWKGSRHDSGVPLEYAERRIQEYKDAGIDPKGKLIVFADGLQLEVMKEISKALKGRIRYTFGWGTDLTNDVGFKSLSIVVKAVEAAGHPVAKLSDNIAKATGPKEAVERMKRLVGYTNTFATECKS
jgi:nicotinate phosphoribosyltransferase